MITQRILMSRQLLIILLMNSWSIHSVAATITATPLAYQDQLMDAGANIEDQVVEQEPSTTGLPRQLTTEIMWNKQSASQSTTQHDMGIGLNGHLQTLTWGHWAIDATLSSQYPSLADTSTALNWGGTIWQRQLWLTNQWKLDQSLGVSYTPMPPLFRQSSRFSLPSHPLLGWAVDSQYITQGQTAQSWHLSAGKTGRFTGQKTKGFESDQGQLYQLATQQNFSNQWSLATNWLSTRCDCSSSTSSMITNPSISTDAISGALAWYGTKQRLQLNLIHHQMDQASATGSWLDGSWQHYRYDHQYGLFWLEPQLAWGGTPLSQDAWGGYYRLNYQFARWLWSMNMDHIYSMSGKSFEGQYLNLYTRYQAPQQRAYGANLALRADAQQVAWDNQTFFEYPNRWGTQRWQLDYRHQSPIKRTQFNVDQTIELNTGQRVSIMSHIFHEAHDVQPNTVGWSLGMYGNLPLNNTWSIDGSARVWVNQQQTQQQILQDINMSLHWRPSEQWEWTARLYTAKNRQQLSNLDPLTPRHLSSIEREQDHQTLLLTLRHHHQAGMHRAILGGRTGDPYGAIQGEVFLDANKDGIRNANEEVASDITVILDGRFVKRTDELGRFMFDMVRIGSHQLTMSNDELPLPWQLDEHQSSQTITVYVRQTQHIAIGATRSP
jgi:hypothetical protein